MSRRILILFIVSIGLVSCAGSSKKNIGASLQATEDAFRYTDKNGQFNIKMSSGFDKKNNSFHTKKIMEIPNRSKDNVLEQSVAISTLGVVKNKTPILRPKISQYNVWFDGKKYTSELRINPAKKAVEVKMISPESQWNGTKQIKFPSSTMLPCFFSQVIECAKVSGFISSSSEKKTGAMKLLILWEGYPYLNETFSEFPSELFSEAELEYDGKTKDTERRFNLRVAGQSIFYILNQDDKMIKMFWVSQGISMVSKSVAKESAETEEGGGLE